MLARQAPGLVVWAIGDPGAPDCGTPDPELLRWCETNGFILVTQNRRTMPGHFAAHLRANGHLPGIFVVGPGMSLSEMTEELTLIAGASLPNEHRDTIRYLPLPG